MPPLNIMMPLIVGIIAAVVAGIVMYVDSRLFDWPKDKLTYFKNMLLVGAISASIVYLTGSGGFSMQSGGSGAPSSLGFLDGTAQEILTGLPTF